MSYIFRQLFLVALLTISNQSIAAIAIIDKGQDGNQRYYTVGCPNGATSTVIVHFNQANTKEVSEIVLKSRTGNAKPPEVKITNICTSPGSGNERCSASWDLQSAAEASCK